MLLILLPAVVALQAWTWHRQSGRIAAGQLTRLQGVVRYGLWALVPLLLFVCFFLGAVGLEELGVPLLSESLSRATLPIAAFLLVAALLGSACFGIRSAFIKTSHGTAGR